MYIQIYFRGMIERQREVYLVLKKIGIIQFKVIF